LSFAGPINPEEHVAAVYSVWAVFRANPPPVNSPKIPMRILYDPACAGYSAPGHVEMPARIVRTASHLQQTHPGWFRPADPIGRHSEPAGDEAVLRAHSSEHLLRLSAPARDFDGDTPALPEIELHARRAAGQAISAARLALAGEPGLSLMRPPGHHATRDRAMGFCYLNSAAIAALAAQAELGAARVAIWDFDAHHGNGTEDIVRNRTGLLYVSVHQAPGYPGTGLESIGNARNFPVAPGIPAADHLGVLAESWGAVLAFRPDLILVSAGFDAYAGDPITDLRLRPKEFAELGAWLRAAPCPAAGILEGGYSPELPILVETFLAAWAGGPCDAS
jgi:acetoin utilization deacetylase AcuC-like enzyme